MEVLKRCRSTENIPSEWGSLGSLEREYTCTVIGYSDVSPTWWEFKSLVFETNWSVTVSLDPSTVSQIFVGFLRSHISHLGWQMLTSCMYVAPALDLARFETQPEMKFYVFRPLKSGEQEVAVEPPTATTSQDSATSFPKYQKFPSQITIL